MNIKPKLRKGYYVVQKPDGDFEYSKVTLAEPVETGIPILKGPSVIGDEGFVVVSTKQVFKVLKNDLFNSFVRADAALPLGYIKDNFDRYVAGVSLSNTDQSSEGSSGSNSQQHSDVAGLEDELRAADEAIADQVKVLFG